MTNDFWLENTGERWRQSLLGEASADYHMTHHPMQVPRTCCLVKVQSKVAWFLIGNYSISDLSVRFVSESRAPQM